MLFDGKGLLFAAFACCCEDGLDVVLIEDAIVYNIMYNTKEVFLCHLRFQSYRVNCLLH